MLYNLLLLYILTILFTLIAIVVSAFYKTDYSFAFTSNFKENFIIVIAYLCFLICPVLNVFMGLLFVFDTLHTIKNKDDETNFYSPSDD